MIQQLMSFDQYAELVQSFKQTHSPLFTNCFFSPDEIAALTARKRMQFSQTDDALMFFVSERHCYRLYFYMSTLRSFVIDEPPFAFRGQTPIVTELLSRQGNTVDKDAIEEKLTKSGFIWRNTFQRMTVYTDDVNNNNLYASAYAEYKNQKDMTVCTQDGSKVEEILALLELCLDLFSSERPDEEKLRAMMDARQVYYIRSHDDRVCAAMVSSFWKKKAVVDHIGVHPDFRRRGMAQMLLAYFMHKNITGGAAGFQLFVDKDNPPAVRLYEKFGFEPDGMRSDLFIQQ